MTDDIAVVATELVDLVYKHGDWGTHELEFNADEIVVLFSVIRQAGFEAKAVVPGLVRLIDRDDDGSALGYGPAINQYSQYKVICENGRDHEVATGWLDAIVGSILATTGFATYASHKEQCREACINMIMKMIEESTPLKPIQLTPIGDFLQEPSPSCRSTFGNSVFFYQHTRDTTELQVGSNIGVHAMCSGWLKRCRTTKEFDAIVCGTCFLRVSIPAHIRTYGELRRHRATLLIEKP